MCVKQTELHISPEAGLGMHLHYINIALPLE